MPDSQTPDIRTALPTRSASSYGWPVWFRQATAAATVIGLLFGIMFSGCRAKERGQDSRNDSNIESKRDERQETVTDSASLPPKTKIETDAKGTVAKPPANNQQEASPDSRFKIDQVVRPNVIAHPRSEEFNEIQLGKDHVLMILAFDSITRHMYFLSNFPNLEPDQIEQVRDLVDSYEHKYTQLRNKRASILESAFDGDDTEVAVKNIAVRTLLLSRQVRIRIQREIMTREQRDAHNAAYDAKRAAIIKARQNKKKGQ